MKRILYVSNHADIVGGGELSLLELIHNLDPKKYSPVLLCPAEGALSKTVREWGIPVLIYPWPALKWKGFFLLPWHVHKLKRLLADQKIDLIHANGSRCMVYAGLAGKLLRVPVLWHVRISETDWPLDSFLYKLATRVVVISDSVAKRFSSRPGFKKKVARIYNAIDVDAFSCDTRDQARQSLNLPKENFVAGVVGRLVEFKGHRTFLEAAQKVLAKYPSAIFLIVGDGPLRHSLEEMTKKLNIREQVIFAGHRDDIAAVMAALDVFVLSSNLEHFGRVLVEAMASAKAVVATGAGASPEIVQDGVSGFLVPPKNPDAMAVALIRLIENPTLRNQMGMAGRKIAQTRFCFSVMLNAVSSLYDEILGS